ncbi:MAG: type II toxin-antitoxin system VapC family toxin [Thermodesulfobacteriota bacterium]
MLDTNILSYWMRGDSVILSRLQLYRPCDLVFSTITLAEILYGIEKSPVKKKERRKKIDQIGAQLKIVDFDKAAARQYAVIRTRLEKKGVPISERDLQIAAIALANDFGVVTHNTKEFNRVEGLTVEDWVST